MTLATTTDKLSALIYKHSRRTLTAEEQTLLLAVVTEVVALIAAAVVASPNRDAMVAAIRAP